MTEPEEPAPLTTEELWQEGYQAGLRESIDTKRLGQALHNSYCIRNLPMHSSPDHSAWRIIQSYLALRTRE